MSQQFHKHPSAIRLFVIDFTKQLATAATPTPEILSSGAAITLNTTDGQLTTTSIAINSSAAIIPPNAEAQVPISQGVQFLCAAGTNGYSYEGTCVVVTNAGNTLAVDFVVNVGNQW